MYLGLILLYVFISSIAAFFIKKSWAFTVGTTVIIAIILTAFTAGIFMNGYTGGLLSQENYVIPGATGISFSLAVTGFSEPLILITSIIFLAAAAISRKEKYPASFYGLMLFAEFGMIGLLASQNFLFFYIFWEIVLIPVYFMISRHGSDPTGRVALKFFVYTQVGSIFMLLSIFSLYSYYDIHYNTITLSIPVLMNTAFFENLLSPFARAFILFGFFLAFLVKMPAFPIHAWFPDSYEKSPYPVTIILTGALSLMGGYGFFGILFPLWPVLQGTASDILILLGIVSLVYFALAAMFQINLKRMMAYASAAAMGFVTLSFGAGVNEIGSSIPTSGANSAVLALSGGMYQMIAHALIMVLVFSALYAIYMKTNRENVNELGGIHRQAPKLSSLLLVGLMASLGLPGLAGFIGEFSVVVGIYANIGYLLFAVIFAMLITASYHVWVAQRALYGPYNETIGKMNDLPSAEFTLFLLLAILIVILGLFPNMIFHLFVNYLGGFT